MFDPMEFEIDEPEKVVYVVGIGPGDVYYLTQPCAAMHHGGGKHRLKTKRGGPADLL